MALPKPTHIRPSGGVVSTNTPQLAADVERQPGSFLRVKARWHIASDIAFTTALRTVASPDSSVDFGGIHYLTLPPAQALHQGTWYISAQAVEEITGTTSDSSNIGTFVVSHPMSTKYNNPTAGTISDYHTGGVRLFWLPIDSEPSATQSAYRVEIQTADGVTSLTDTGKTTSTDPFYDSIGEVDGSIDVPLRWRVTLWDDENVEGPASTWDLFSVSLGPTVTVTDPSGTITAPGPVVDWDFEAAGGRPQTSYRVQVTSSDGLTSYFDSGVIATADTSFEIPGPALPNNTDLQTIVTVTDSGGFTTVSDPGAFSTAWAQPDQPTILAIDDSDFLLNGDIGISWDVSDVDPDFFAWRVYRRIAPDEVWTLLSIDSDFSDSSTDNFDDYTAPNNSDVIYAIVQVKLTDGVQIESNYDDDSADINTEGDSYWLSGEHDSLGFAFPLYNVTDDEFTDEFETQELLLIGGGRRVEIGTEWGMRGTLTADLMNNENTGFTARDQRLQLETLKRFGKVMFLKTPFGDLLKVYAGDISMTRVSGVGLHEYVTATIPYVEVI